jgi:pimeloyl-ACP methyl ester carboxylesterase
MTHIHPRHHAPDSSLAMMENIAMLLAPSEALVAMFFQSTARTGDGHPVLVIPGLGVTDMAMASFHEMLRRAGYDPTGWGLGMNGGYSLENEEKLAHQLRSVSRTVGRRVSIIGWSMGGMYARAIAQDVPDHVRQVITLGTPWRGIEDTTPALLWEYQTGHSIDDFWSPEVHARLTRIGESIPVPFASIYSRDDGIASWESCHADLDPAARCQSVTVSGQHFHLPVSVEAFDVVAHLLRQREGEWAPHPRAVRMAGRH